MESSTYLTKFIDYSSDISPYMERLKMSALVRNLGLWMDRHLSYEHHVDKVVAKCTGLLLALNHAKHVLPPTTVVPIIQALVFSTIRYCISIYGTCSKTQLHRIQKIINFSARVVSGRRKHSRISQS